MNKGQRIKKVRENAGINQTELASRIGVSKQNLYKYENSIITNIPSDKIEAIAKECEVSPEYIMGWTDDISHTTPKSEPTILDKYNQLNTLGKEKTDEYVDDLLENPKYVNDNSIHIFNNKTSLKEYDLPMVADIKKSVSPIEEDNIELL